MLILYKNHRNVRFVLFTKTSNMYWWTGPWRWFLHHVWLYDDKWYFIVDWQLHFIKEKRKRCIKEMYYSSRVMKSLKANNAKIITTLALLFHLLSLVVIHFWWCLVPGRNKSIRTVFKFVFQLLFRGNFIMCMYMWHISMLG